MDIRQIRLEVIRNIEKFSKEQLLELLSQIKVKRRPKLELLPSIIATDPHDNTFILDYDIKTGNYITRELPLVNVTKIFPINSNLFLYSAKDALFYYDLRDNKSSALNIKNVNFISMTKPGRFAIIRKQDSEYIMERLIITASSSDTQELKYKFKKGEDDTDEYLIKQTERYQLDANTEAYEIDKFIIIKFGDDVFLYQNISDNTYEDVNAYEGAQLCVNSKLGAFVCIIEGGKYKTEYMEFDIRDSEEPKKKGLLDIRSDEDSIEKCWILSPYTTAFKFPEDSMQVYNRAGDDEDYDFIQKIKASNIESLTEDTIIVQDKDLRVWRYDGKRYSPEFTIPLPFLPDSFHILVPSVEAYNQVSGLLSKYLSTNLQGIVARFIR